MDNRDAFRQHVMETFAIIENNIDGTTGFTDFSQNHKKYSFGWKSAFNRKLLKRMARFKDWHKLIDRVKAMPWRTIGWVLLCSGVFWRLRCRHCSHASNGSTTLRGVYRSGNMGEGRLEGALGGH
jgi:hypothetical protein